MGAEIPVRADLNQDPLTDQRSSWEALWSTRKRIHVYDNILELAETFFLSIQGAKVLEVGCGRGATLLNLVKHGAVGSGLDYADNAIDFCKELQQKAGVNGNVRFLRGDALDLPFDDGTFDLVYSIGLIEHFANPKPLLAQQFRVLKPGGIMIVQVPQKYSLYTLMKKPLTKFGIWRYGVWETQFSDAELRRAVEATGFVPEYSCGYGSFSLALLRHFFFPTLNFGRGFRIGQTNPLLRKVKAHIALDLCLVARKP